MHLAFYHIPKTAGTSVHQALAEELGLKAHPRRHEGFAEEPLDALKQYQLLSAHMTLKDIEHIRGIGNVFFTTVLRDPVERLLSEYDYLRTRPDSLMAQPGSEALRVARSHAPRDYFDWLLTKKGFNNYLLRRTLGKAAFTESDVLATINFFEDFGLVGVADYLDEYLAALFERYGRTRPFCPAFLNRTEDQPDPERAGAKTLRTGRSTVSEEIWARLTWGEQRVYEHFKKRFEREHAERIFNTRVHYGKILRSKAS